MEINKHIGKKVREARTLLGDKSGHQMTQTDLGNVIGVSFQQIQKYENGSNKISGERLYRIAAFFGVPISYFFEGLSEEKDHPVIAGDVLRTANLLHELPDGPFKKQILSLVKTYHSEDMLRKAG